MALLLTVATGAWAQDPDPIDLTPSADGTVWTLSTMPEYDVELEVTYYTDAELDQMAADEVIAKITAIGTVTYTPESKALIDAARTAYDALTAAQQALVTNYSTLTDAEAAYAAAEEEAAYTEGVEHTYGRLLQNRKDVGKRKQIAVTRQRSKDNAHDKENKNCNVQAVCQKELLRSELIGIILQSKLEILNKVRLAVAQSNIFLYMINKRLMLVSLTLVQRI